MRLVALLAIACGAQPQVTTKAVEAPTNVEERILGMLPDGVQVIVEIDLARLRDNPVVGDVVKRALEAVAVRGDAISTVPASPLADASAVVLAAYGVGTSDAGTVTILATTHDVPGGKRIAPDLVAIGPDAWVDAIAARAPTATAAPAELLALRAHAMPAGATGASLRVTARLSFDARVALARQIGVEVPPQQVSIWGDVADDLAIVVDADAADPGDGTKVGSKRLAKDVKKALATLADTEVARGLGIPNSLTETHQVVQGTWVRTILAIGPAHLKRVVTRAGELLPSGAAAPPD